MRDKILKLLRESKYTSGEHIAKQLRISRTAVWKQINNLKKSGYEIESVKRKGYRLISKPDNPIPEEIIPDIKTSIIGKKIYHFNKIDSTNFFAEKLAKKGIDEGTIIIAEIQTDGKGRLDRKWFSPELGLWFSIVLYPLISPDRAMLLTMTASISVAEGIKKITGIEPVIKWPNDLLIEGKKVCGILTEIDAEIDRINFAVIGIGLNVNNILTNDLKTSATTLKQELGKSISRVKLIKTIIEEFDKNYSVMKTGDYEFIKNKWISMSNIIGKKVKVTEDDKIIIGVVNTIDDAGSLIIDTTDGKEKITHGDLQFC